MKSEKKRANLENAQPLMTYGSTPARLASRPNEAKPTPPDEIGKPGTLALHLQTPHPPRKRIAHRIRDGSGAMSAHASTDESDGASCGTQT